MHLTNELVAELQKLDAPGLKAFIKNSEAPQTTIAFAKSLLLQKENGEAPAAPGAPAPKEKKTAAAKKILQEFADKIEKIADRILIRDFKELFGVMEKDDFANAKRILIHALIEAHELE